MSLALPADLEPFCDDDHGLHDAGAYVLDLERPADPVAAWDRRYDNRPPWFDQLVDADAVVYVGATGDVLSRLEDHRDGEVRQASVVSICSIDALRSVHWASDYVDAEVTEYNLAAMLRRERPDTYVHSR